MNIALIPGKEKTRFFHFYKKAHIADIVFVIHQTQMAVFRKEMRNRDIQESTEFDQVKKRDVNNNVSLPASGRVAIIRAPEIAFDIEKMGLMLKVVIQHGSERLFLNIQDRAR